MLLFLSDMVQITDNSFFMYVCIMPVPLLCYTHELNKYAVWNYRMLHVSKLQEVQWRFTKIKYALFPVNYKLSVCPMIFSGLQKKTKNKR